MLGFRVKVARAGFGQGTVGEQVKAPGLSLSLGSLSHVTQEWSILHMEKLLTHAHPHSEGFARHGPPLEIRTQRSQLFLEPKTLKPSSCTPSTNRLIRVVSRRKDHVTCNRINKKEC